MTFDIPSEQKKAILESRLNSLNLDGYQYELSKKTAEALGDGGAAAQAENAMNNIIATIAVVQAELDSLDI
jgi:hypothetical protein